MPPDFLNSREDAILVWSAVFIGWVLWKRPEGLGGSLWGVLRVALFSKLTVVFSLAALYSAGLVYLAQRLGVWHTSAMNETVYWFVGTALLLVGRAIAWSQDPSVPERLLRRGLELTIVIEFLINLYVFPLAVELVLLPIITLFVLMQVVAKGDPSFSSATAPIDFVLIAIGAGLIIYAVASAATDPDGFFSRDHAERFLIGPVMTIALMPLLLAVVWWCRREQRNFRRHFYPSLDSSA
jgi:hypothetical protein